MKRIYLLISVLILLFCFMNRVSAQKVVLNASGNYVSVTASKPKSDTTTVATVESLTKSATKTDKVYVDSKGTTYPVYQSKGGAIFIVRTSKKTGKLYKSYLKVQ